MTNAHHGWNFDADLADNYHRPDGMIRMALIGQLITGGHDRMDLDPVLRELAATGVHTWQQVNGLNASQVEAAVWRAHKTLPSRLDRRMGKQAPAPVPGKVWAQSLVRRAGAVESLTVATSAGTLHLWRTPGSSTVYGRYLWSDGTWEEAPYVHTNVSRYLGYWAANRYALQPPTGWVMPAQSHAA